LAWAGLLAWGLVATVLAVDPLHAWLGTPDRRLGWLSWLLFGGLFWAGRRLQANQATLVLRGVVVGALGMSLLTAAERIGWSPNADFAGSRLGGPFGQPAFLGAAACLAAPICVGLAVADRSDQTTEARVWRLVAACAGFLTVGTLLASQARAAWLGALAAALALVALRNAARRLLILPIGVPVVAVLAVPDLQQRLSSAGADGGVVAGRWDEWQVGLRALTSSPVVGYGPEGYRTVFGVHVDEAYVVQWGRDVITDRAHQGLLDTALAFGLPGALLAAAILGAVLWRCGVAMAVGDSRTAGLAVGVAGALVGQQFLFPLSELDPLLWLLAGMVATARTGGDPIEADGGSDPGLVSPGRRVLTGLAIGLAAISAIAGLADLVADRSVATTLEQAEPAQPSRALTLRGDSIRYRFVAARLAAADDDLGLALQRIDEGLERSPSDPALSAERATLLLRQAEAAQFDEGGPSPTTVAAAEVAAAGLNEALTNDPLRPDLLNQLGFAYLLAGRPDLAVAPLEQSVRLDPDNGFAQQNLDRAEQSLNQAQNP
jgi:O-antigen ligase